MLKWVIVLVAASAALVGLWLTFTTPGWRPEMIDIHAPAQLAIEPPRRDLGTLKIDKKYTTQFHLINRGGRSLVILRVEASCGCTAVKPAKTLLPPGTATTLAVTLDTSNKLGPVTKTVDIHTNDPAHPVTTLKMTANVKADKLDGHGKIVVKDPLVLFKGECATCHVDRGRGKTGKALFEADCAMCHGSGAKGGVAPALRVTPPVDPATLARWHKITAEGTPHNPTMPPFSQAKGGPLSDAEIASLVQYLKFESQLTSEQ